MQDHEIDRLLDPAALPTETAFERLAERVRQADRFSGPSLRSLPSPFAAESRERTHVAGP